MWDKGARIFWRQNLKATTFLDNLKQGFFEGRKSMHGLYFEVEKMGARTFLVAKKRA